LPPDKQRHRNLCQSNQTYADNGQPLRRPPRCPENKEAGDRVEGENVANPQQKPVARARARSLCNANPTQKSIVKIDIKRLSTKST